MPPLTPFADYRFKDNMTRGQNNYTKQAPDTGKQKSIHTCPRPLQSLEGKIGTF